MPGVVTKRFRIHNAEQFQEAFSEAANTRMYIYIGRLQAWPNADVPPTPEDTIQDSRFDPWRNMIAAKRVQTSDVSFSVPRYNWVTGTVYTEYDDKSTSYYDGQFYVVTDQYNVYKCLFNNRGAASTVKPTGTSTSIIITSDGYKWKYMYTIDAADALKFVTTSYIPVKTLTVDDGSTQWDIQQAASNNSIDIIDVTANGSSYAYRANTFSAVASGTTLTLDASASGTDDAYTNSNIYISSGLGAGQTANVTNYVGATKVVTVSPAFSIAPNTSSSFHIGPKVIINGDGTGAKAYANVASGQVTHINMINVGSGYSRANVTISDNFGSSAAATPRISPPGGHGSDPVGELGGWNVMLNVRVSGTEGNNFPTNNDFRILGILKNPLTSNDTIALSSAYDQTTKLTLSGVTGTYQRDEMVNGDTSSALGRVVGFANTNAAGTAGVLKVVDVQGTFTTETITANTSSVSATISSTEAPELRPYSGDIIYRENRAVTSRTADQIEDIKIVVRY